VTDLFNPTDKQHVMLYPGDMVEVAYAGDNGERIDVAMIHWVSPEKDLIGVEFGKTTKKIEKYYRSEESVRCTNILQLFGETLRIFYTTR